MKAAGANANGAVNGFMGLGMMGAVGGNNATAAALNTAQQAPVQSSAVQFSRQHLQQLPQQQAGHALAARLATPVSSAAIADSLSRLLQQQVGHALAARQATQVSSAVTADSLSLQQLLQLALSAASSPLTALCLSSALSAAQRSNKILWFYNKSIPEAVSMRQPLF